MPEPEEKAAREAAEAAARAAAGEPAKPFASFETADAFNKRMDREAKSRLKEHGIEDPAKAKAELDAYHKILEEQAAAELAKKGEIERAQVLQRNAETAMRAAQEETERLRLEAHLSRVGAAAGVTNIPYMLYEVGAALGKLGDNEQLDEVAFIDEMKKDPAKAAALGIPGSMQPGGGGGQQPPPAKVVGATTTGGGAGPDAKQQQAGGGTAPTKDAFEQTPAEFNAGLGARYGFSPSSTRPA